MAIASDGGKALVGWVEFTAFPNGAIGLGAIGLGAVGFGAVGFGAMGLGAMRWVLGRLLDPSNRVGNSNLLGSSNRLDHPNLLSRAA